MSLAAQRGMGFLMVFPSIFMAIKNHKTWVFIWVMSLGISLIIAPIITIIENDIYGWLLWIFMLPIMPLNGYIGAGYYGITKSMGLPHLPFMIGFIIYSILRLSGIFNPITYNNQSILFIYSIIIIVFLFICCTFDIMDTYIWFIKKDRSVIRSPSTLNKMITIGLLKEGTNTTQNIYINGKWVLTDDYNEWGLIK